MTTRHLQGDRAEQPPRLDPVDVLGGLRYQQKVAGDRAFAALDIATGQVTGACKPGIGTTVHKHLNVKKWLGNNPRIVVHCAPTHAS